MKKITRPMKTLVLGTLLTAFFLVSCEDTTTNNNGATNPQVTTPNGVEPLIPPEENPNAETGNPLYLEGFYATSNNEAVSKILDDNPATTWTTQRGTGTDERIMLRFQNKIFLKKIQVTTAQGAGLAEVKTIIIYGDDAPVGSGQSGESIALGETYSSLYVRFAETNQTTDVQVEAADKSGAVQKFSRDHAVGIQDIKLWDEDGNTFRLVPPRKIKANITATSTLQPATTYRTFHLFDGKQETAWVEGAAGAGEKEQLNFQLNEAANIDEVKIWNGYQRSENLYKANARMKGFSLMEKEGKAYEYTLRDDAAAQNIDLTVPLKNQNFSLQVNSVYQGKKYEDLAVSELLFFENGKPLVLETDNSSAENALNQKVKGTVLENLLNYRVANKMIYPNAGFYAERSILLRSDGTFVMYLSEKTGEDETDGETFESIVDGTWEVLSANAKQVQLKISGKILDVSAMAAQRAGENEQAALRQIFSDKLTIENNLIKGEKILDEIVIR